MPFRDARPRDWRPVQAPLAAALVIIFLGLVGFFTAFQDEPLLAGQLAGLGFRLNLGTAVLLGLLGLAGARAAAAAEASSREHAEASPPGRLLLVVHGAAAGLAAAVLVGWFIELGQAIGLSFMFPKASPALYRALALGADPTAFPDSAERLVLAGGLMGGLGAAWTRLRGRPRRLILPALLAVLGVGLFGDQFILILRQNDVTAPRWVFPRDGGLAAPGAIALGAIVVLIGLLRERSAEAGGWLDRQPQPTRRAARVAGWTALALVALVLPWLLGTYHSDVLDTVGLFILMGLGLNIVVGFAGMLDLGYVAFFALGAYTSAVLTSRESFLARDGHGLMGFWGALVPALVVATLGGVLLGIPVLKMRGDYLAIITLGFGEIIRILALSDWLAPYLGGSQGIANIAPATLPLAGPGMASLPVAGPDKPQLLYYLILAACLLAAFIATRLKHSRLGRSWMAIREDEDVAQAMGIHLVKTKLLAFGTGATLSGLAGTLFGAKLLTIYPHSFDLLKSINILALIIVGGMGNVAGVVVGALALVGLPEVLRDFQDFRWMAFGAILVWMMLHRPEGLLPDARRQRELRETDGPPAGVEPV